MSRTLIIKNANFAANAVATIEFSNIACTGITLAEETYLITNYTPVEVEYTVTPSDTTDAVQWQSSNTDIVTVDNGIMTVVGIGTCTITATCGEYSASATVTVSVEYIPNWDFAYLSHPSTALYATIPANLSRITAQGSGEQAGAHSFLRTSDVSEVHPVIKLPKNTASITIERGADQSTKFANGDYSSVMWMSDEPCGNASYPQAAKFMSESDGFNLYTNQTVTLDVPSGVDSFGVSIRLQATYTSEDVANTLASTIGMAIIFNPSAT